jgi:Holliday junction resolvasome RuvABC endonuclease subunit
VYRGGEVTILKLDPSLTHTGIVVIEDGKCVVHTTEAPKPTYTMAKRLGCIMAHVGYVARGRHPNVVLVEVPHKGMRFGRGRSMLNADSVRSLNWATGAAIAAVSSYCADVRLIEAKPMRVNGRVVTRKAKKMLTMRLMRDKYGVDFTEHEADAAMLEVP